VKLWHLVELLDQGEAGAASVVRRICRYRSLQRCRDEVRRLGQRARAQTPAARSDNDDFFYSRTRIDSGAGDVKH
jgi:hypothetical protein